MTMEIVRSNCMIVYPNEELKKTHMCSSHLSLTQFSYF